jgi:hypothetical protein
MADKKISQLTALSAANLAPSTDVLAIVDTSATETKKVTAKDLVDGALNGGTANGVLYLNGSKVATSGSAFVFDGTNLGLGVTPSAWTGSGGKNIEIGATGNAIFGSGSLTTYIYNANFDSSWKYSRSDFASRYEQQAGQHRWYTAPSGTAGNAISFTQALTLDASGRLLIGLTSGTEALSISSSDIYQISFKNSSGSAAAFGADSSSNLRMYANGAERARITAAGSVVAGGSVALATTATDGFLYVPTCAGTPTGTPTAITGMAPIVVNTTNNKLYFYSGGAWRDAGP